MSPALLAAPAVAQALALAYDERHFHRKRRLPLWERVGHPLDTLTMIAALAWARLAPWSDHALLLYAALAAFSCLFVTKDEIVHSRECEAGEQWIHAILFLLHPLVLVAGALLWRETASASGPTPAATVLTIELIGAAGFMVYQFVYWNILDANRRDDQQRVLQ